MKLFIRKDPEYIIRLQIIKQGAQTEYINLVDTTIEDVKEWLKTLINAQNLSIFEEGRKTMINIRESVGGENGRSTSLSFRGLNPKQTFDLIIKNLPQ